MCAKIMRAMHVFSHTHTLSSQVEIDYIELHAMHIKPARCSLAVQTVLTSPQLDAGGGRTAAIKD